MWTSRYFFSPRIWHHAGRPTTGHSAETIGKNNKHNGRRTIARYPWNNRRSKPEFLQKMNLTNHIHLIIYTRLNDIEMVLLGQSSWFWYHLKALNETNTILATTFKLKIWKEILNLIILINFSEINQKFSWLTVIFESLLYQQSTFKVQKYQERSFMEKCNTLLCPSFMFPSWCSIWW